MSINFGAGADVHATRRLLHQQDARLYPQPFAERHFLLVAAGQLACPATKTSPIDFEKCGQSSRQFGLAPRTDEAADGDTVDSRRAEIFSDRPYRENSIALAIIGTISDTLVHRITQAAGRESITA